MVWARTSKYLQNLHLLVDATMRILKKGVLPVFVIWPFCRGFLPCPVRTQPTNWEITEKAVHNPQNSNNSKGQGVKDWLL